VTSRVRKTRSAAPAEADPQLSSAEPAAAARHRQARDTPAPDGLGRADRPQAAATGSAPPRQTSRRALKNWHVRSRLVLLITIPTLTAIVLGGIRIGSSVQSAIAYQQVERLATLSRSVTGLAQALELERDETVRYIVRGTQGGRGGSLKPSSVGTTASSIPERQVLAASIATTNAAAAEVVRQARAIGGSYPPLVRQEAQEAKTAIAGLPALRAAAAGTNLPALAVSQEYENTIDAVLALDNEIALGSNDSGLADTVQVLGFISRMKEEVSEQGAILTSALASDLVGKGSFGADKVAAITTAEAQQASNLAEFNISATAAQRQLYQSALSGLSQDQAQALEQQAILLAPAGSSSGTDPTIADASSAMMFPASSLHGVEQQIVSSIISRATALRNSAILSAVVVGIVVILVLALAMLFTTIVGRSMVRPLRRLRAGALEVAGIRLPETVRRMSENDGDEAPLDVEPIDVDSADEIGEVARAFDQVHREALRLAANEAALRGNVNAMFVNLSRRSQSLVERQIQLIDSLELGEQDAERLSSLFQMDHLATRMRRNSENLLVLAGHEVSRRWNQPVALVDVLRAAVSEIEQYERVTLNVQPGIAVRGQAVNDFVHLLSELAENATSFSSAETPVTISGHLLSSGGVLLDITDQGVGMGTEEMAHANWRLDNPPVVDVAVSRRMGLFVVARLAARHGIRVRLRPAASGGLTALVWLPDETVTHEGDGNAPGLRRSDANALDALGDTPAASGFATAGPAPAGAVAGVFSTGEWGSGERSAAEDAVTAARMPKFAPLRADTDDDGGLRVRRVPGAGPMPGAAASSPGFRTTPQPAADADVAPFAAGPSAVAGLGSSFGNGTDVFTPRTDMFSPGPDAHGTVPEPAVPESAAGEPVVAEAAFAEPAAAESAAGESAADEPAVSESAAAEPAFAEPAAAESLAEEAAADGPAAVDADPFAASADGFAAVPEPVLGAPTAAKVADRGALAGGSLTSMGWMPGSSVHGGVVLPPAASMGEESRLPIFESVESDWFRRGRHAVAGPGQQEEEKADNWISPADDGWRAAEVASAPTSGGLTPAGLPKRVPKANLVPGTAGLEPAAAPAPARSAAATRERFASFQRGVREGRAARRGDDEASDGEDDGGT
jgi:signal transduction histidine kinase